MPYSKILFIVIAFSISSCKPGGKEKDVAYSPAVYAAYRVEATEGNDNVAIIAQLYDGGEFGDALPVTAPASFTLDGEPFSADSAKFGGVYYEIYKPLTQFSGTHTITYTDANGVAYGEKFSFQPFSLLTTLPETVSRGDIELELSGLGEKEILNVLLIDTAYQSQEINNADTVFNGKLLLSAYQLSNLMDGPVQMELSREVEQPIKNKGHFGGKIIIYQALRREFLLKSN